MAWTGWSRERMAQHRACFPREEAGERNRLAQARYRARHAKQRASVRKITNLLLHRHRDGLDLSALAAALCECLGQPGAKALCEELRGSIDDDDDA